MTASFSLTSDYLHSVFLGSSSGLGSSSLLVTLKTRVILVTTIPAMLLRALFPTAGVAPKPMLRGRKGPRLQGLQVFTPKGSTEAATAGLPENQPFSAFLFPLRVSPIKKKKKKGKGEEASLSGITLAFSSPSLLTSCFVTLGKFSYL